MSLTPAMRIDTGLVDGRQSMVHGCVREGAAGCCGYGAGGIIFPILGGWLGDAGNYAMAFVITGVLCMVGALAASLVFPPHRDEAQKPFSVHGFLHNAHLFERERTTA